MKKLDTHLCMSTAYYLEMDGSLERLNKTAIESLWQYINVQQTDWADHLTHSETAINNSVNATTTKTLTELLYGVPIWLFPAPINSKSEVPAIIEFLDKIEDSLTVAKDQHTIAKTHQTTQTNRHRCPEPTYQLGDWVYLNTRNLCHRIKNKNCSANGRG